MTHLLQALAVQQQSYRVFNDVLDTLQEGHGLTPVYESVIVSEGHIHDRTGEDVLANHQRPLVDAVHAQDG